MATDHFRYDLLVQDALRGMVRRVLGDVSREGLPGDHHFLVTFRTEAPGVRLSKRMRDKYPEEMTIVLQHQFWDLAVTEHSFEVGLSFGNVPERLLVPFESITSFVDPSVQFGLRFEVQDLGVEQGANDAEPDAPKAGPRAVEEPARLPDIGSRGKSGTRPSVPAVSAKTEPGKDLGKIEPLKTEPAKADATPATEGDGAKVVSIDAFRKKP